MGKLSKRIKLSGKRGDGKYVLVDADNFDELNKWRWHLTTKGYSARTIHTPRPNRKEKTIFMHRIVNETPDGFETDHINRNKLDNRKSNLRTVTNTQNQLNKDLQKNNSSGFIGISRRKNGKWWARIYVNKKMFSLGCYNKISDAVKARKNFAYGN